MTDLSKVDRFIESNLDASIDELARLVAVPSVGAQGRGLPECAALVAELLRARGFTADVLPSGGAPVVCAERGGASERTLLFYNHYDVQPAEPLELWDSEPFTLTRRGDSVYGRGISDDKGHITARLLALDALLAVNGGLPCRVKFVVEGEEETSSTHLHDFIVREKRRLAADACVWEFGGVDHREVPLQYCGLRGICYVELSVETASTDVHSGMGGSLIANAAWRLTWALAHVKGPDGRVRIPGFYDAVRKPTARDIELLAALPEVSDEFMARWGVKGFLNGLTGGVELRTAEVFEPTCTICGLTSGYQGPGSKTVLPARASAKIDFRLVPDMTPEAVVQGLRAHLDAGGFEDVQIDVLGGERPARTDPDDPFVKLVCDTAEPVYGMPMQCMPLIGGSGPNHPFVHELGVPVATAGLGHPGTLAHAPNENVRLDLYVKHAKHVARILEGFARP
jgi:acetylornithine deacetylase/succinyl-diaminopimelate desuccinylase-like protein